MAYARAAVILAEKLQHLIASERQNSSRSGHEDQPAVGDDRHDELVTGPISTSPNRSCVADETRAGGSTGSTEDVAAPALARIRYRSVNRRMRCTVTEMALRLGPRWP
jgi:hypothetical protein